MYAPLYTAWFFWLPIGLALLGMVIGLARRREEPNYEMVLAFLGAIGFGYLAWRLSHSYVVAVFAFSYSFLLTGMRWNEWVREKYKFARLIYWVIADALPLGSFIWGFSQWPGNWIFYTLWVIGLLFVSGLMQSILISPFPIVGRQEIYRYLGDKDPRRASLKVEIARLEAEKLRQEALQMVSSHAAQVARAAAEAEQGNTVEASRRIAPIQAMLEKIQALTTEQKTILGQIYLLQAKMRIRERNFAQAEIMVRNARPYVQPDLSIIAALAENAARANDRQPDKIAYCIEYLQMRRGQPMDATAKLVSDFLQGYLSIDESSATSVVNAALTLAEKVRSADASLSWPYLVIGTAYVLKGQYSLAVEHLQVFLDREPNQWQAHYFLGLAYYNLKNFPKSYQYLLKSLSIKIDQSTRAAHLLGGLLLDAYCSGRPLTGDLKTDLDQSIQWLQQAVKQNDKNPIAHYDLARAYQNKGNTQKARQSLEYALKLDAKFTAAHLLLADILYEAKDWTAAYNHYQQVLLAQPSNSVVGLRAGHCLFEAQLYKEAIEQLQPLEKENPQAALLVARSYLRLREFRQSADRLNILVSEKGASPEACYYLGCALAWLGKQGDQSSFKQAMKWFDQVEEIGDPIYTAKAQLQLGHIYLARERASEAVQTYRKAYASHDLKLEAGLGLVKAYLVQDCETEAMEILSQLVAAYNKDRRVHSLQGLVYERQKKLKEAEESYRKANATGPLAIILFMRGETRQASEMCRQARKEGNDSDRLLYFSGLAAAAEKDYSTAISEWQILSARYPEDVHLRLNIARSWYLTGCEYYRKGDYAKTVEAWEQFYKVYHIDDQVRENLGNVYLMRARQMLGKTEAEAAVRRARDLRMSPVVCDFMEGLHRLVAGDNGGTSLLRQAAQQQPENPQVLYNLGLAEMHAANYPAAESYLRQASQCGTEELREQARWALAAVYARLSDWSRAADAVMDLVAP